MKNLLKLLTSTTLTFICFFASTTSVFAGFGVSPATIMNDLLKPGARFEKEIHLSRSDPDEDLLVIIEPELGEAASWFKFEPGLTFDFPKGQKKFNAKAIITVPKDIAYKQYTGVIRIKATNKDQQQGGVAVIKGVRMEVNLVTTELNVPQLNVRSFEMTQPSVAAKNKDGTVDIGLKINIENTGNVDLAPSKIVSEISTLTNTYVDKIENYNKLEKIPANQTKQIEALFRTKLNSGEYFFSPTVYLNDKAIRSERLVFKVLGASEVKTSTKPIFSPSLLSNLNLAQLLFIFTLIVSLLALLWFIIIFRRRLILKKKLTQKEKRVSYLILFLLLLSLISAGLMSFVDSRRQQKVKGVSTSQSQESPTPTPTIIRIAPLSIDNSYGNYYVYQQPDLKSPVIYAAREGENLTILDQNPDWYHVRISDTVSGWLPKTSVKATQ